MIWRIKRQRVKTSRGVNTSSLSNALQQSFTNCWVMFRVVLSLQSDFCWSGRMFFFHMWNTSETCDFVVIINYFFVFSVFFFLHIFDSKIKDGGQVLSGMTYLCVEMQYCVQRNKEMTCNDTNKMFVRSLWVCLVCLCWRMIPSSSSGFTARLLVWRRNGFRRRPVKGGH